jgi:hypothetical protein
MSRTLLVETYAEIGVDNATCPASQASPFTSENRLRPPVAATTISRRPMEAQGERHQSRILKALRIQLGARAGV